MSLVLSVLPAALGVASYALYFNHGEHHLWATTYIQLYFFSFVGSLVGLTKLADWSLSSALATTSIVGASYLFGVFTSLLVYRIWLSPLNKFPGPWQAKISNLWMTGKLSNYDCYLQSEELHKKYGKYVRIGANDLSISDANVHEQAFGQNRWMKSHW